MPLPLILGIGAAIAAVGGVSGGIYGGVKTKHANDKMKEAQNIHNRSIKEFEKQNSLTNSALDTLGNLELKILDHSFCEFSELIEKIQNRPKFDDISFDKVELPKIDIVELKKVSIGARVLTNSLSSAAAGTAGAFAASGATTAAVTALGAASTGTAISSLSGAAATNAVLAALGGGSLAVGGGGIALGTLVLGAASAGVAVFVGGVIFGIGASKLSDRADEAYKQAAETKASTDKICEFLQELMNITLIYKDNLTFLKDKFDVYKIRLSMILESKQNWNDFNEHEKLVTENFVRLTALMYKMCQVKLLLKAKGSNSLGIINKPEINSNIDDAKKVLEVF